jgi:tRNA dimethylallyltransferase
VSIDSAQVYRGMDAGTAKPSRAEREGSRTPDRRIVDPDERYSAAIPRRCDRAVEAILSSKRFPLLVGGTMLYYRRACGTGLDALPAADPKP